jgi:hypothetical protein
MSKKCPLGHLPGQNADTGGEEDRTVLGRCLETLKDSDRTPRGRGHAGARPVPSRPVPSRPAVGAGLSLSGDSPTLVFARQLFQLLDSGVASVSDMRNGRPWPRPRIEGIRKLVEEYGTEVALAAAKEAREIVQSQDRAPNVTGLFAKKCADIAAEQLEREAIRDEIRKALA